MSQALTDVSVCMLAFSWPPQAFDELSFSELRDYAELAEIKLKHAHG